MTKAELINEIKNRIGFDADNETYAMSKDERDFYTSILKILEQEPCDDCVSRQALLNKAFEIKTGKNTSAMVVYAEDIRKELPILPKREQGEWIGVNPMVDTLMCSKCGENIISEEFKSNYCPNCGAEMR